MSVVDEVINANEAYASSFTKGDLAMPPGRGFAIVTCMDARIDPAKAFGLEEGDAHVIRNAGGLVTDDALRSLAISHCLLGTQEFLVAGHTGCGMLTFTNEQVHGKMQEEAGIDCTDIDFQPFPDLAESIRASLRKVRESPLTADVPVSGWIYEVETGRLVPVD